MLRVTTLYAASAVSTAAYYTRYLADTPGEEPGRWRGQQAEELGLSGQVDTDIPAITQRRHLEAERQKSRSEPTAALPDWVEPWRQQLQDRRQLLIGSLVDRENLRAGAGRRLQELEHLYLSTRHFPAGGGGLEPPTP